MGPGLRRDDKAGFSLLELTMVLVIIGMIAGGVVLGQSLYRSSQVQGITKDILRYRSAVNMFTSKYRYLPGDLPTAYNFFGNACGTNALSMELDQHGCNGNGDGMVRWSVASQELEIYKFWSHLQFAGILDTNLTGIGGNGYYGAEANVVGGNMPEATIPGVIFQPNNPINITTGNSIFYAANYGNAWMIGTSAGFMGVSAFLRPAEALLVDQKTDDGVPSTGKITTYGPGYSACATSADPTVAAYNVSVTTIECFLRVDIPSP